MLRRWKSASLRAQLIATIMGLLLVALVTTGAGTMALLHSYLQSQIDDRLSVATTSMQKYGGYAQLTSGLSSVPTDYSVVVLRPGAPVYRTGANQSGYPDIEQMSLAQATSLHRKPFDIAGTTGHDWRAVAVPFVDQSGHGYVVVVGLPLAPVDEIMEHAILVVVGVGLLTLILAFFIATWTVTRSFRPLARVERTAAAIASGDLSQRVDIRTPHTEVGRLATSLNTMLANIESAFAARTASEQRMRRFAADASHELRTPLVTIRGFSELYRHGALRTDADVATAMGRIESEAKRMGSMVEDLLTLARLDEQRPLQEKPFDLMLLGNDAVVDTRASAPQREVRLVGLNSAQPVPAPVLGDEAKIRQVVSNLVGNALRYTPEESALELAVGRQLDEDGSWSVLEVRDHGPGISEEDQARIFERFYRADTSRTRETGGSGLGLAIVAAIVGSHGGTVRILDTPGGGATFQVRLPHSADDALASDITE
ncbi:two-component system OmpR family sensor kinase [Arthrobacter woluwensis]|uniref:sensor histidine kinase n=1 Tax=Arthrobacter woluwensis TaxID=156980 RepID=UPI00277ECD58|nr:HAMP domain-containing sensor histidine kinase [Arthrobacter woluwensis]MDQ0707806.1 two-component system OmpR family sensor kinase [Arthrobacter woluwensis]